mgnify:CR=1 FL=1
MNTRVSAFDEELIADTGEEIVMSGSRYVAPRIRTR